MEECCLMPTGFRKGGTCTSVHRIVVRTHCNQSHENPVLNPFAAFSVFELFSHSLLLQVTMLSKWASVSGVNMFLMNSHHVEIAREVKMVLKMSWSSRGK